MPAFDTTFPPVLTALHQLPFDYADGEGMDFEPYEAFQSAQDNEFWIRAWTGNQELDGADLRVFGQDGTGGYVAFWLVREGVDLLAQPIVFFGSEGELGVVARDFDDYLWLLANGVGPYEAVAGYPRQPNDAFTAFAGEHAKRPQKTAAQVLADAAAAYPDFESRIRALCR